MSGLTAEQAKGMGIENYAERIAAIKPKVAEFAPDSELIPGTVKAVEIKGHTPGHSGYLITSGADSLLYVGDSMHHFVVSVQKPEWTIAFDGDAPTAQKSRAELIASSAANGQRIYAVHFPFPGLGIREAGRRVRVGSGKLTTRPLTLERLGRPRGGLQSPGVVRSLEGAGACTTAAVALSRFLTRSAHWRIGAQLKALVKAGRVPGLIAYRDGDPVGWVSLGPREDYAKLARSPVMRPVDDKPVWSIIVSLCLRISSQFLFFFFPPPTCFVVPSEFRVARASRAHCWRGRSCSRENTVRTLVEAYPVDRPGRFGRRFDVVWREVDVRRCGIFGSGASQAAAAHRAPLDYRAKKVGRTCLRCGPFC